MSRYGRWAPLAMAALGVASFPSSADVQKTTYSRVELIAEQATLPATGGRVTLGFHLEPDPGWHAYWVNPGDAGKAPSIDWALPTDSTRTRSSSGAACHPVHGLQYLRLQERHPAAG